jgi:hypothetical protein
MDQTPYAGSAFPCQVVSPSRRFWEAVLIAAFQDKRNTHAKVHTMSDGDEHRLHCDTSAYDCTYGLTSVHQVAIVPSLRSRLCVFAAEFCLRASNRGNVEHDADVAGKAEPSGMCKTMCIKHQEIGNCLELLDRLDDRGAFPEAQQPRDIGEPHTAFHKRIVQKTQLRIAEHHCCGIGHAYSVTDIDTGHVLDRINPAVLNDGSCKVMLEKYRLAWCQVPSVLKSNHNATMRCNLIERELRPAGVRDLTSCVSENYAEAAKSSTMWLSVATTRAVLQ